MEFSKEEKKAVLGVYINRLQEYTGRKLYLEPGELSALAGIMEVCVYKRRAEIIRAGNKEQYLHFIQRGLIRQYFSGRKKNTTIAFAREGEAVSSCVSYFSGTVSICQLEALEPTVTLALPKIKLERIFPYSYRISRLARIIIAEQILKTEHWEMQFLRYTIRERFLMFRRNHPDLFTRVPKKFQASYLDIEPETYSRLQSELAKNVKLIQGK